MALKSHFAKVSLFDFVFLMAPQGIALLKRLTIVYFFCLCSFLHFYLLFNSAQVCDTLVLFGVQETCFAFCYTPFFNEQIVFNIPSDDDRGRSSFRAFFIF